MKKDLLYPIAEYYIALLLIMVIPIEEILDNQRRQLELLEHIFKVITKEDETFLSSSEVAKMFVPKISIQTVNNWSRQGRIKKRTIGGKSFFLRSDVLAAIKTLEKYKR